MKLLLWYLLLLTMSAIPNVLSEYSVPCDKTEDFTFDFVGSQKSCLMRESTFIDFKETTISSEEDENVTGFALHNNKNIFFLPVDVSKTFSNLVVLKAWDCSLTTISRENFRGLGKLQFLDLESNYINKITRDTFRDLESLEWIWLSKKNNV